MDRLLNVLEAGFDDAILGEIREMSIMAEPMRKIHSPIQEISAISVVTIPEKAAVMETPNA